MEFYERNLDTLKDEYAKDRKEAASSGGVPLLFLKKGITIVRVMPPFSDAGVFFRELWEHSLKVNGKFTTVTCARCATPEGPCPLCEEGETLKRSGDETNIQLANDLQPKRKYLFNVIVMSDPDGLGPDKGVHVMKCGIKVKKAILDLDQEPVVCGDVTDIGNGVNIRIEKRGQMLDTEYTVHPVRDRSDIAAELAAKGIDINTFQLYNLFEVLPPREYEEAKRLVSSVHAVSGFPTPQAARPMMAGAKQEPRVNTTVAPPGMMAPKPVLKLAAKPLTPAANRPILVPNRAAPELPDPPQE